MDKEFKQVGNLLPTQPPQEQSIPLSDVLTDLEKKEAIDWAADQERKRYVRSMQEKGVNEQTISQKVSEKDFYNQIDAKKVLRDANQRKHWKLEEQQRRENERAVRAQYQKSLIQLYNADFFYQMIETYFLQTHGKFIINDNNNLLIEAVCLFLSRDPRFESKLGFSFKKGLMVVGVSGLGKTKVFESVKNNELRPIKIYNMVDIIEAVREKGNVVINTEGVILLDDVGTEEPKVLHYGTEIRWYETFIQSYYNLNQSYDRLLITTNCGGEEIQNKYGYRVRSRMREMFNVIEVKGNDLRS